jgi:hypothetical protein
MGTPLLSLCPSVSVGALAADLALVLRALD